MTKEEKRIYDKKYRQENKEKIALYQKTYREENSELKIIYKKKYYLENKEKITLKHNIYRQENKEKMSAYCKKYYLENKQRINARNLKYNQTNKQERKAYSKIYGKKYRQENKDIIRQKHNNYVNSNPVIKLKRNLRSRVRRFFNYKGYKKKNSTEEILGANWKTVESFMEAKFVDGMNWDNIGEWHIDHIIPLSSAETEKETIKLCHYTNLQPLWAFDNISKGNRLDWVKE